MNLRKIFVISIGSTAEPYYCSVNRMGVPEYIGENDISLPFAPSGTDIEGFQCKVEGETEFTPCKFYSQNSKGCTHKIKAQSCTEI